MTAADAYTDTEVLCQECQHPLREPASRALGLGPVCRKGLRGLAHPPAHGQLALDLDLDLDLTDSPSHPDED
jgi:hypothetical protein